MKKIFALLILCALTLVFSAYTDNGIKTDESTDYMYVVSWKVTGLDSSTANATVTSAGFDAKPFIDWFLQGNLAAYTLRDTTVGNYIHSNYIYSQITVNGTGTADSLNYVYLQGKGPDNAWYTFDTLNTAKATPCQTIINLVSQNYYTQWRIKINVADLTVSMYAGEFNIKIFSPIRKEKS